MIYLVKAAIPTLGIMLYEIFYLKNKKNPLIYVLVFVTLALSAYLCDAYLYAKEVLYANEYPVRMDENNKMED